MLRFLNRFKFMKIFKENKSKILIKHKNKELLKKYDHNHNTLSLQEVVDLFNLLDIEHIFANRNLLIHNNHSYRFTIDAMTLLNTSQIYLTAANRQAEIRTPPDKTPVTITIDDWLLDEKRRPIRLYQYLVDLRNNINFYLKTVSGLLIESERDYYIRKGSRLAEPIYVLLNIIVETIYEAE